jgi:predicted nucleotidyltransferase/DNA-binding transcriptional ArsR family regulator
MYLDKLLGSKTKINLLSVLVSKPERSFIESELAKEAGAAVSEVNRQITDLVSIGLVTLERVGKSKLYKVDQKHFLYVPLKELFTSLEDVYKEIAHEVTNYIALIPMLPEVKTIILFGSLSSGKVRENFVKEPSDIDLVIVVQDEEQVVPVKNKVLDFVNTKVFPVYGVNVYPIVLSVDEYISGLSADAFIMNVHSNGEVLYGEKPRRFG